MPWNESTGFTVVFLWIDCKKYVPDVPSSESLGIRPKENPFKASLIESSIKELGDSNISKDWMKPSYSCWGGGLKTRVDLEAEMNASFTNSISLKSLISLLKLKLAKK